MRKKKKSGFKLSKTFKILLGILALLAIIAAAFMSVFSKNTSQATTKTYTVSEVKNGSVASSTLLTGTVKSDGEQYVYYETNKGDLVSVIPAVGDQVEEGQALVQYDSTAAQAAYDQAIRNYNKVSRQISDLQTYGVVQSDAASLSEDGTTVADTSGQTQRSYQSQLNDLNDSLANAQDEINKTEAALNDTVVYSKVAGTVVEVNTSVNPSSTSTTGQVLVHIVSQGQQQVEGKVTEYDLANLKVDQDVKITSKVYPDKEWTGKISYISNYPEAPGADANSSSSSSSYPFKVNFTSDAAELKQGFKVSVEVLSTANHPIVPLSALVTDKDKHYVWVYDDSKGTVTKTEVTLGSADATDQEVTGGLSQGQWVVEKPSKSFKDGQKIQTKDTKSSE